MLKDGTYAAWFKTPLGEGTGIAHVASGQIGVVIASCPIRTRNRRRSVHRDHLKEHTGGHAAVFGAMTRFGGGVPGKIGTYTGTAGRAGRVA